MSQAILFFAIIPFALAMVLLIANVSGRMSERLRDRFEGALMATLYPVITLYFAAKAWDAVREAEWFWFGLYFLAAAVFLVQFGLLLQSGGLLSRFRTEKG